MHKALLLLAVRWKQTWRQSRSTTKGSSFPAWLALLIILIPMSLLFAFGASSLAFTGGSSGKTATRILSLGFAAYYLYSLLSPFFGKELGDTQEIEKARLYPFATSTLYGVTLVTSAFSPGFLFLLPALLVLLFASANHLVVFLTNLLVLILFVIHTAQIRIGISLLFANLLRGRRYQDILRLLMPLMGVVFFTLMQFTLYSHPRGITGSLMAVNLPEWVGWTPPFWHSGIIAQGEGDALRWSFQIMMVLVSTPILGFMGVPLLKRALVREVESSPSGRNLSKNWDLESSTLVQGSKPSLLQGPLWAVFRKELKLMRREPAIKTLLVQQSFLFLLPFVGVIVQAGFSLDKILAKGMDFLLPSLLILLYVEFQVCFLSLGFEGRAIQHLLMTPISMGKLLVGKNLAFGVVALVWNSLLVAALSTLFGSPQMSPVFLSLGITLLLVVVGWGSLSSVILPVPVSTSGKNLLSQTGSERRGCLFALWNYVNTGVLVLLSLPPLLLYHFWGLLDRESDSTSWLPLGVCFLYAVMMYLILLLLATRLLQGRQYKVLDLFVQVGR
jgi:hypothetical protein